MTGTSSAQQRFHRRHLALLCALLLPAAHAQDGAAAAERARLANQRIQAEAERRAQEEEERLRLEEEQARREAESAAQGRRTATEPGTIPAATQSTADGAGGERTSGEVAQMLQQLRTLGELKDAGYVTEQEFERIKKRILDASL